MGCIIYCGVIVLFGATFGATFYLLKHSDAYRLAVSKLKASTEVTTILGTPITTGFPSGNINTNNASGAAALSFLVSGLKGTGGAFLEASKKNGAWSLSSLKLKIDGRNSWSTCCIRRGRS